MTKIGLIMAGGKGTRLFPTTSFVNKHLLQIYDKPLIYYPLSTLMLLGINKIFLITNVNDIPSFYFLKNHLSKLNIEIEILSQNSPKGILDGLNILKDNKINKDTFMILGDNILVGSNFNQLLPDTQIISKVFSFEVSETSAFGIYEEDKKKIIEKPKKTNSNRAITGLYFYKKETLDFVENIKPSKNNKN